MSDEIGRGDYVLGVDKSGVTKGVAEAEKEIAASGQRAEKTYAESAQRAGEGWGRATAAGVKVVTTAAVTAFGLAAKSAIELQNVTADYRAETGATAAEAERAGKAINGMFKRNTQDVREIGGALTKVHTDLGLVGDDAEKTTEIFLRFARVTKQDASAAVVAFDDVLDAWGLQASDAQSIMDKLIVSHQKYGGSIEGNQRALANLAPQLRALNLTVDDGIGLLNLFASSGLDAGKAQSALNTAITKLPPGTSLRDYIASLANVVDDGERARLAIEVFGQKAGPALANALRPGGAALDDYKVSAQDAAGALNDANKALDDTFGAQAQRVVREFIGGLNDIGPALTGAAGIVSIAGALGVDNLVRALGPKVVAAMKGIGKQGGDALGDGLGSAMSGAEGTVVGNNIATRLENIADPTKNTIIGNAWRKAGDKAATVYLSTLILGDKLGAALSGAFNKLPFSGPLNAAVARAGAATGVKFGSVFGAAVAIGIPLAIGLALAGPLGDYIESDSKPAISKMVQDALTDGTKEGLQRAIEQLRHIAHQAGGAANPYGAFVEAQIPALQSALDRLNGIATTDAAALPGVIAGQLGTGGPKVTAGAQQMLAGAVAASAVFGAAVAANAAKTPGAIADALRTHRGEIDAAFQELVSDVTTYKSGERARTLGYLLSRELTHSVNADDDLLRNSAREKKKLFMDYLGELLAESGGKVGKEAMDVLNKALHDKDPAIRGAAREVKKAIHDGIKVPEAKNTGQAVGDDVITGLRSRTGAVAGIAYNFGALIARNIIAGVRGTLGPVATQPKSGTHDRALAAGGAFQGFAITSEQGPELVHSVGLSHVDTNRGLRSMIADAMRPMSLAAVGAPGGGAMTTIGDIHVTASFPNVRSIRDLTPADLDDLELALGERVQGGLIRGKY